MDEAVSCMTRWKIDVKTIQEHLDHLDRIARAGADNTGPEWTEWLGPPVTLWRKFRETGEETEETLPRALAEWTLLAIPEREPSVERAKVTEERR